MNKQELVDHVAADLEWPKKDVIAALDAVTRAIQVTVGKGEKVVLAGFGSFEKVIRAAYTGRNPATGESVAVEEAHVPKFRAGTGFKAHVAQGAKVE